jgi:hypothetical protein
MPRSEKATWPRGWIGIRNAPQAPEDITSVRRWIFLCAVATEMPPSTVFASLALARDLSAWAKRWNLDSDWVLEFAQATLRGWERYPAMKCRAWFPPKGHARLVTDLDTSPAAQKAVAHFSWLARYQVKGEAFARIARDLRIVDRMQDGSEKARVIDEAAVRHACVTLASELPLPLRATRRGRPKSKK